MMVDEMGVINDLGSFTFKGAWVTGRYNLRCTSFSRCNKYTQVAMNKSTFRVTIRVTIRPMVDVLGLPIANEVNG